MLPGRWSVCCCWSARDSSSLSLSLSLLKVDGFALRASDLRDYPTIRLWGSLSFGLSQLVIGSLLDAFRAQYGFSSIFALQYVLAAALVVMILGFYPQQGEISSTPINVTQRAPSLVNPGNRIAVRLSHTKLRRHSYCVSNASTSTDTGHTMPHSLCHPPRIHPFAPRH
jgi:hypothetical protein